MIEEKQRELNDYMEQRTRYLKRIEELEVEISRYRYLVTGKKDRCLADEVIGHIKLEIHKIIRMSSEALLKEYLARGKKDDQNP